VSKHAGRVRSLVGGWNFPYRRFAPLSAGFVTWPFGRLDVYEDRLVFRARGPFHFLVPERIVALDAITGTEKRARYTGVRVLHDGTYTSWAPRGRASEKWLADYLSNLRRDA
jgi:hypothetical protein